MCYTDTNRIDMTLCCLLATISIGATTVASPDTDPGCWTQVPASVRSALHLSPRGPFPFDASCLSYVFADFNGDEHEDHAILVGPGTGQDDASLLFLMKREHWTLSVVRTWRHQPVPTTLRLLPPGLYRRPGGLLEGLEGNEVPILNAKHVGLQVGSWAYFWQSDRWVVVRFPGGHPKAATDGHLRTGHHEG
jgi:hypothetical protein